MASDYFAPEFSVKVNGVGLNAEITKMITQLTVVSALNEPDQLTLTLVNPYPEMRWTGKDVDLFKEGGDVQVELGYVGKLQRVFDGEIMNGTATFPESGTPTLAITAYNRLHRLMGSERTTTFTDRTDAEIAADVADRNGLSAEAEDTQIKHAHMDQRNQTDLNFLRERAAAIGYELEVAGKTLFFRHAQTEQSAGEPYTLVWGQPKTSMGPGGRVLPLLSFSLALNVMQQVDEVVVRGYDPRTKSEIVGRSKGGAAGSEAAQAALNRERQEVVVALPVDSQEEADARAEALYRERARRFKEGNGATIGSPDFRAGRRVKLQGLGERIDGDYRFKQVTHMLSSQGYRTSFTVNGV